MFCQVWASFVETAMLRALDEATPKLMAVSATVRGVSTGSLSLPGGHLRPLCSAVNVGAPASLSSSGNVPSAEAPVEYRSDNVLQPPEAQQQ